MGREDDLDEEIRAQERRKRLAIREFEAAEREIHRLTGQREVSGRSPEERRAWIRQATIAIRRVPVVAAMAAADRHADAQMDSPTYANAVGPADADAHTLTNRDATSPAADSPAEPATDQDADPYAPTTEPEPHTHGDAEASAKGRQLPDRG